jgi:hypothetical protein
MLSDTQQQFGSFERSRRRGVGSTGAAVSAAGLAALVAAALLAAAPASAGPAAAGAPKFTHSAKRGELRGGRLILHGVAPRVHTEYQDGRTDRVLVRRLHARLFAPGKPATGKLRHSGGDKSAFRLSRPRYSAAKRTVSYRAKPLDQSSVPRRFGRASLAIVGHPEVALTGQTCVQTVVNYTGWSWKVSAESNSGTDSWDPDPSGDVLGTTLGSLSLVFRSVSPFARGCWYNVTLQVVGYDPDITATFSSSVSWNYPLAGSSASSGCTPSTKFAQNFTCELNPDGTWWIANA